MSTLSSFLSKQKARQESIESAQVPAAATDQGSADSPSGQPVATPSTEQVKVEESTAATVHISQEPVPSLPVRTGSLTKLLSTPKPEKVLAIPPKEKFIEMMSLEDISNITGDQDITDPDGGQRFRFQLDTLDRLMAKDHGKLDMFNIDTTRNIIARIMIDWKENPAYDGLVVDTDTRNIMMFMYATQQRAIEANAEKATKAEKTVARAGKKAAVQKVILDMDFDDMEF